jgi:hypothetical protein
MCNSGRRLSCQSLWAAGEYLPLQWDLAAIQADAEAHLVLVPAD